MNCNTAVMVTVIPMPQTAESIIALTLPVFSTWKYRRTRVRIQYARSPTKMIPPNTNFSESTEKKVATDGVPPDMFAVTALPMF